MKCRPRHRKRMIRTAHVSSCALGKRPGRAFLPPERVPPNGRFTPASRPCASLDVSMRQVLTPRLILVTLGHFTIDSYSSFFSPLLPLLVTKLHLSLTLVGTLVAFSALSSSFAQPLFGWFADRVDRPWFVAFGPLVAAVFLSSIGLAPSYGALVGLLLLGGIGVAAVHPPAGGVARDGSPRRGIAMSFFVTGG